VNDSGHNISIRALKSIAKGDEIYVSYVKPELEFKDRTPFLLANYGFACTCPRCQRERPADPTDKEKESMKSEWDELVRRGAV